MISKEVVFRIFSESEERLKTPVVERYCTQKAAEYLGYKEILAITGVRRCGKTYLMFFLMQRLVAEGIPQKNIVYLNFEDERLSFIEPKDLDLLYEYFLEYSETSGKLYFFLDEIQNVPLWEKWLSRMFEKVKFVISGSSSALLSSEIATAITGRSIELELFPFSFKEYVLFKDKTLLEKKSHTAENKAKILILFSDYLGRGSFPEVLLNNKPDLLQEYFRAIILRDIIKRYTIRHTDAIEKLSLFLLSNIGKPISLYGLEKEHPLGINTIKNYLSYMEKCYLIRFVKKYDYSLRKQNANPRKVYSIDTALSEKVSFKFSEDKGRVIENLVLIEFLRRKKQVYYHKKIRECDFVIQEGLKIKKAIQVCYELNKDSREREINGLLETLNVYELREGLIISYEEESEHTIDNKKIMVLPIWKWLLSE